MPSLPKSIAFLLLFITVAINPVGAFVPSEGPKNWWGKWGVSHAKMTENAWMDVVQETFGITTLTATMRNVLTTVKAANGATDDDQSTSDKHFDGESFPEGQKRLQDNADAIVKALQSGQLSAAHNLVGTSLHTIQDFYSHTNWIELGNSLPHPDLGVAGKSIDRLAADVATCQDCDFKAGCNNCSSNVITSLLTSGYYGGQYRVKPNTKKCSHGGPFDVHQGDASVRLLTTDGINKDMDNCVISPHSSLHYQAVGVATAGSIAYLKLITARLTDDQIQWLMGVESSVSILTSTKSSSRVKRSLNLEKGASLWKRGLNTVQARHFDGHVHRRQDIPTDSTEVDSLDALPALYSTVVKTPSGAPLFVWADATADMSTLDERHISTLASWSDIKIYIFLLGPQQAIDPDIWNVTQRTGGQVFSLEESELSTTQTMMALLSQENSVDVVSVAGSQPQQYAVPVDSTLSNMTISFSGSTSLTITRPDGSIVQKTDSDVTYYNLTTGAFIFVPTPQLGQWNISTDARTAYSLSVTGVSPIDLSFDFVRERGRPGHESLQAITSYPADNSLHTAIAAYSGSVGDAEFSLRSKAGIVLQTQLNLTQGSDDDQTLMELNMFYTNTTADRFSLTNSSFLVYLSGVDDQGYPFQRVQPAEYTSSAIGITPPPETTVTSGSNRNLTFLVHNRDVVGGLFNFTAVDALGQLTLLGNQTAIAGGVSTAFYMAANASTEVTVNLQVVQNVSVRDVVSVNVRKVGSSGNGKFNFAASGMVVVSGNATRDTWFWNGTLSENGVLVEG